MNIRQVIAGAAVVMGALAAGTGIASAIPSVSYVPRDDPTTPHNEAGTIQTTMNPDEAAFAANALSPLNPVSPLGQQLQDQINEQNDCYTINSRNIAEHTVTPYQNGPDGNCNQPVG